MYTGGLVGSYILLDICVEIMACDAQLDSICRPAFQAGAIVCRVLEGGKYGAVFDSVWFPLYV
jgi:hypothetical protein